MPSRIRIETNIPRISKIIEKMPTQIFLAAQRTFAGTVVEITRIMSRPATLPSHPIKWDSAKQARAWFLTKGFGLAYWRRGGHYQRTNRYVDGWKYERFSKGYLVENIGHKAIHITGDPATGEYQSRIHRGRWPKVQAVIERVIAKLPQEIVDAIKIEILGK